LGNGLIFTGWVGTGKKPENGTGMIHHATSPHHRDNTPEDERLKPKNHPFVKENHLNQTSMIMCKM